MTYRYEVTQLKIGYSSTESDGTAIADGSVTLVRDRDGSFIVLVDTGGPWGKDSLLEALRDNDVVAGDVTHVVGTHGHSDHVGNLNLFPAATFVVGTDVHRGHRYSDTGLGKGEPHVLGDGLTVLPTPGHTGACVSLMVEGSQLGTVVVAGDLFEREDDLVDPTIWQEVSENPEKQRENRAKVLALADYIVPGHGKMFKVPPNMKLHVGDKGQS